MSKPEADGGVAIESTPLLACPFCGSPKERAELAEATLERLALDATDGYVGGAQRLVLKWLQDTKANSPLHVLSHSGETANKRNHGAV